MMYYTAAARLLGCIGAVILLTVVSGRVPAAAQAVEPELELTEFSGVGELIVEFHSNCQPKLTAAAAPRLLLSIEPIVDREVLFKPTAAEMVAGREQVLQVPQVGAPVLAGLFICRDANGDARCNSRGSSNYRRVADIYDLLWAEHKPSERQQKRAAVQGEELVFFHPVVVAHRSLYLAQGELSDSGFELFDQFITVVTGDVNRFGASRKRARRLSREHAGALVRRSGRGLVLVQNCALRGGPKTE